LLFKTLFMTGERNSRPSESFSYEASRGEGVGEELLEHGRGAGLCVEELSKKDWRTSLDVKITFCSSRTSPVSIFNIFTHSYFLLISLLAFSSCLKYAEQNETKKS
jgi:hypothetical protein